MTKNRIHSIESLRAENHKLFEVLKVNKLLASSLHLDIVLKTLLEKTKHICLAQASSIMFLNEKEDELYFHTANDEQENELKKVRLKVGEGIAGWVVEKRRPVLIENCQNDPRFSEKADHKLDFATYSMMCIPLEAKGRILGTIQVINRIDGKPFDKQDLRIFQILAEQAAIAIENARLHEIASVDGMTGLYRKDYFSSRLQEEFIRSQNTQRPLSFLMTDLDRFKKINDSYGHQGGDQVLIKVASMIRETVYKIASEDIAGRYGGEEFSVLLPGKNVKEALEMGEEIRQNIASSSISINHQTVRVSVSLGVSAYPLQKAKIHTPDDLILLADRALYLCKERGRNCVMLYEE